MSGTVSLTDLRTAVGVMAAPTFIQTNLISDGTVAAAKIDPNLINPWGISFGPTTPFWLSDQGTGKTSIDGVSGATVTVDTIPPVAVPSPTGQVFNNTTGFVLSNGSPATFLFASTTGTISGWNGGTNFTAVTTPGAVYTGLAIGSSASGPTLYAANNKAGTVDMFDASFKLIKSISDPNIPIGFGPYNAQVLGSTLYVAYSAQDRSVGAGKGFVDAFDLNGTLIGRVASAGTLNDPWGLAIAPPTFGSFANDLLIGNFGDGTIDVFDPKSNQFLGQLTGADHKPLSNPSLWALIPGGGGAAGDRNTIYFTAGLQAEQHGLFGSIIAAPPA